MQNALFINKIVCNTIYNHYISFLVICKYKYLTFLYEYLAEGIGNFLFQRRNTRTEKREVLSLPERMSHQNIPTTADL